MRQLEPPAARLVEHVRPGRHLATIVNAAQRQPPTRHRDHPSAAATVPLQISHISVVARLAEDSRWAIENALRQVDEAQQQGLEVGFDMHTRLFGTTNLSTALPPWALEGDRAAVAARLNSPSLRRQMKSYQSILRTYTCHHKGQIIYICRCSICGGEK